jgi:hypothetical protein
MAAQPGILPSRSSAFPRDSFVRKTTSVHQTYVDGRLMVHHKRFGHKERFEVGRH